MELVQASGKDDFKLMNLNSTTEKINKTLGKIKEDFIYIGFLLWEIREYKHYLSKGYESVIDYAEKELNFKKSTTYNFISVCEKFSRKKDNGCPTMNLDEKYKDFSFAQLVEIKTLPVEQLQSFDSNMSNREIREKKKELKNKSESKRSVTPVDNAIDVEFIENKNVEVVREDSFVQLDYKENVIKYLTDRVQVLKDLVKSDKKNLEFRGALHEVDLLLDCISKDEI